MAGPHLAADVRHQPQGDEALGLAGLSGLVHKHVREVSNSGAKDLSGHLCRSPRGLAGPAREAPPDPVPDVEGKRRRDHTARPGLPTRPPQTQARAAVPASLLSSWVAWASHHLSGPWFPPGQAEWDRARHGGALNGPPTPVMPPPPAAASDSRSPPSRGQPRRPSAGTALGQAGAPGPPARASEAPLLGAWGAALAAGHQSAQMRGLNFGVSGCHCRDGTHRRPARPTRDGGQHAFITRRVPRPSTKL